MLHKRRLCAALALGLVVLTSCSSDDDGARAGVGVRAINTNVGLGIEIEAAAPANVVVRPRQRPIEPNATVPPLDFNLPKPVKKACPEAGPFDFPEFDSGVEPKGRPAPGNYDWKQDGRYTDGFGDFAIDTFDQRKISNVKDHSTIPEAFTFDLSQGNFFDSRRAQGTLITHYRVVPQPAVRQEQLPNDVGKGLFIEGNTFIGEDEDGNEFERTVTWSPAVQLIAFPVKDGTAIDSTGSDLDAGARLTIQGAVKGKKQIDACGSRVDSWFVDANLTYTVSNDRTGQTETYIANYDYAVAPQYGGQPVFEKVEAPRDDPVLRVESRIGRVPEVGK